MSESSVLDEVRAGVRETGQYLLSHHERADWDRCYAVGARWRDRPVRLCARCSGIYPGILAGALFAATHAVPVSLLFVALLPVPTVAERALEAVTSFEGSNRLRTATGALLGSGYGIGLVGLTRPAMRLGVLAVGAAYVAVAVALLSLERIGDA